MRDEIKSRYGFHKPDAKGVSQMTTIRVKVRELAHLIDTLCPESRGKATALTHLDFVMMQANSSIVQQYPLDPNDFPEEHCEFTGHKLGNEKALAD